MKPPPLGIECASCHQVGMLVRREGRDVCQHCGAPGPPPLRTQFTVVARYTIAMDDTTEREAKDVLEARFNEMLGALERKDDVRVILLHQFEVEEQR